MAGGDEVKCPLCGEEVRQEIYKINGTLMSEFYEECLACEDFSFEFAYGASKMRIGIREFIWDTDTPDGEYNQIQTDINGQIELFRNWELKNE